MNMFPPRAVFPGCRSCQVLIRRRLIEGVAIPLCASSRLTKPRSRGSDSGNLTQLRDGIAAGGRVIPVAVGGRWVLVRRGTEERRIGLDGSFEAISDVIRCAFNLKTRQEFCLEDEFGIMRPLDRTMPTGTYTLTVNPGVIITFCYARDPKHTECEVYTKTFATQDDLSKFLEKNRWIGLISRGDDENEIIDIMDDLQHDVVYHGLSEMQCP